MAQYTAHDSRIAYWAFKVSYGVSLKTFLHNPGRYGYKRVR